MKDPASVKLPDGEPLTSLSGLTDTEASQRLENGLGNSVTDTDDRSVSEILAGNIFTFFNLINVILAAALAFVGSFRNMLFLGTVLSNTVISTVQELRARSTLKKLKLMNTSPVNAMRDGR